MRETIDKDSNPHDLQRRRCSAAGSARKAVAETKLSSLLTASVLLVLRVIVGSQKKASRHPRRWQHARALTL